MGDRPDSVTPAGRRAPLRDLPPARVLAFAALTVAALLLLAGPSAGAQERNPDALWDAYPLEGEGAEGVGSPPLEPTPVPALQVERPAQAEPGPDITLPVVVAVLGLAALTGYATAMKSRPAPARRTRMRPKPLEDHDGR